MLENLHRRQFAALTLSAVLFASAAMADLRNCSNAPEPPLAVAEDLDGILRDSIDPASDFARLKLLAPGAVMLVRTPDWTYFKSAGVADLESGAPLDCLSPYEIGSATKMMTGAVLMQLQEAGRLSLDDKLADHLPEFASRIPFGEQMTLRQLATHTSGFFSYTDNAPDGAPGILEGALEYPSMLAQDRSPAELVEFAIQHGTPSFEPGAEGKWAYSNTGYILLGMIIENMTGKPLADVFRERIFVPVGMEHTFLWNDVPQPGFDLPRAWFKMPFDRETTGWNLSQGWAAGGVISTAPDMALFIEALARGDLFEKPETLNAMLEGVPADLAHPIYGIGLAHKPADTIGHGGQTLGFESDTGYAPESGTTFVMWTNSASSFAALGIPIVAGKLAESQPR